MRADRHHVLETLTTTLGSFSNDDDDGNANGKKTAISLDWENNNFARAYPFLAHFFAVVARPRRVKVMLRKTIRNDDF